MSVASRQVQNKRDASGVLTGRAGTVYDVRIKYKAPEGEKVYTKKGFPTKKAAEQHEAEMKTKLSNPTYTPIAASHGKMAVQEYLDTWVEQHGKANLRPSTFASYKGYIKNHINPNLGHIQLRELTPAMLDGLFQKMFDKGLSQSSVRYAQRIMSVAFEGARKYHYIETNPARDILTKFGKQGKTPDPYTVAQMQQLMGLVAGKEWEMPIMLVSYTHLLRLDSHVAIQVSLSRCMLGVSQTVSFGGFGMVDMLPESPFIAVLRGLWAVGLFLWPARRCSYSHVQASERSVFPGL